MRISETDTGLKEKRNIGQLQTLYVISSMLKQVEVHELDISTVLSGILKVAIKQLNAQNGNGSIIVINENLEVEHAWLSEDGPYKTEGANFLGEAISHGLAGWVIRQKKADIIDNTLSDERWLLRPGHITTYEPWSVICAPFIIRNRAIGAITIHKPGPHQFDNRDLYLLTAISSQAARSIENALLYEESQRQLHILGLLHNASQIINSSLDIDEIMQSLLSQMNAPLNAEATSIALVDKRTNELVYRAAAGVGSEKIIGLRLPSNQGLSGWVMKHARPALVANTNEDARFTQLGDLLTGHSTQAMICAPIQFKGNVLGTLQAINPIQGTFSERDLNLLVSLANIASSAIANAQQFARAQAANRRYMNLFQDSINPIILTNMKRKIIEVNRQAIDFFGYRRHELLGESVSILFSEGKKLPTAKSVGSEGVKRFTCDALAREGTATPVEVYVKRTLFMDDNEVLQWLCHDISHQMELELMRKDLMAMLFHDLQSPLSNVISSLNLMQEEISPDEDFMLASLLDIASRSSDHLQTLISSLLDIDRLEAGHPIREQTDVDVVDLLDVVEEIKRPDFERRRLKLVRQLQPDLPHVYIEQDMIRRVLLNLLDNALRYSGENAQITIQAGFQADSNQVLMSVKDNGVGIPKRYHKSIFEKFQRIKKKSSEKGLGLGLAFCRLAVEAHGGSIWVDDAPGGGAQFSFTLPVSAS